MANAYSVIRARQGWIDPTDQDFTLKALMFKQQKYDAGQAKVQSVLDKYESLQLARGVDREYLNSRMREVVDSVNTLGPQDLSSNTITSSITNHIGQVLDNNVMTAVQETAKIRAYQSEVAQVKEKHPELYNPLNEAYGISPAQDYLNSTELGAKIQGSLTYTPFKDVQGEMGKYLLEIQKSAKNGTIQVPVMQAELDADGVPTGKQVRTGEMKTVTINGMSANELQNIAMNFMGNKYDDQIKISTWANTGGFKNMEPIIGKANQQYQSIVTQKTKELADLNSLKTGNITEEEKALLDNKIKSIESEILDTKGMQASLVSNPQGSLIFLEKQRMAISSGQAIGQLQTVSTEYKKDDYYFGVLDQQSKIREEQRNLSNDSFDREYKTRQLELEEIKIGLKANGTSGDGDSSSTGGGAAGGNNITFSTEDISADEAPQESAHNQWKAELNTKFQEQVKFGGDVMNQVNNIASGRAQATPEKVRAAKALVANFTSKGGQLNPLSEKQTNAFMKELSRADAYSDLTFLPVGGKTAIHVKNTYDTLHNEWTQSSTEYKNAKLRAQQDEAKGAKRGFADNEYFIQAAERFSSGLTKNRIMNIPVHNKNKGIMQTLISSSEEVKAEGSAPIVASDTAIQVKNLKNGKYQITFQAEKGKGEDKSLVNQTVTVTQENLNNFIPETKQVSEKKSRFTIDELGTKPLFSPSIAFLPKGSNNYDNYKENLQGLSTKYATDSRLLDNDEARTFAKEALRIKGIQNPKLREELTTLVDAALSPSLIKNIKTSVYYDYSTISPSGKGYVGIHSKNGDKLMSISLGVKSNLEEETRLNQYLPQVIYSRGVIQKLNEVVTESIKNNKLTIPEDFQKLINNG